MLQFQSGLLVKRSSRSAVPGMNFQLFVRSTLFLPESRRVAVGEALKIVGPLDLDLVGSLVSVTVPLAQSNIGILPIGTFETDYVLVRDRQLGDAVKALRFAGFEVIDKAS